MDDVSATTPDFMTALGLGAEAIDHEVEMDAFHALREDYQSALRWIAGRDQQREGQDPVPPIDEVSSMPTQRQVDEEPRADADVELVARPPTPSSVDTPPAAQAPYDEDDAPDGGPAESVHPEQRVLDEFLLKVRFSDSEAKAQRALDAALRDPGLSSIDAPARFERRVAVLLANGWQPGHQFLLLPAIQTFGWTEDFRRLETLGPLGEFLKAAIWQRQAFHEQRPEVFKRYANLIRRLRDETAPTERELLEGMPRLSRLMAQTPEWLQVVTSVANIRRWQEAFDALPESKRLAAMKRALPAGDEERQPPWWKRMSPRTLIWLFLLLIGIGKQVISELNR
jgi:periplasmic protein TonB